MLVDWKLWTTVDDYNYNVYGAPYTPETYFVKFKNDTLIGGVAYKKIMKSFDVDTVNFICVGYARETSDNKKVFFRNLEGIEGCVYDFSINQGDTITHLYNPLQEHLFNDAFNLIVDSVYSVTINGNNYRAFDLIKSGYPETKETIIEGIGSECGILETGYAFSGVMGWSLSLLCYWENNELTYHANNYDYCFFQNSSGITQENINNIQVFPNPVQGKSKIVFPNPKHKTATVYIYSPLGKLINTINTQNDCIEINANTYSKGVYTFKVHCNNNINSGKFVVL